MRTFRPKCILPIGPEVVPFLGLPYRILNTSHKRNYFGAYGYTGTWSLGIGPRAQSTPLEADPEARKAKPSMSPKPQTLL